MQFPRSAKFNTSAFSLVEVALSLGIVSFVLLALFGLMSVGLDAGRSSQLDTVQASVAHQLLANLRSAPFTSLSTPNLVYYDATGNRTTDPTKAFFECAVTATTPADPNVAGNLLYLKLEIRYPSGNPKQTRSTINTSIARHD